ncbi:HIRAN domain-containing protein [Listeria costaricensis]|uniref:HIRAN domain-containing protein n=1 Tax=Listeria costaricensis TaxID=2026604 RepID=UPI0013C41E76|nr:HIRAN domain-containing protein [Listeria costaricensis]
MQSQLCLLWQNCQTRQWYHVGTLFQQTSGSYIFRYETSKKHRGLNEALQNGYKVHPSFPDIDKVYTSENLFSAFSRRIPDRRRPDYQLLFKNLGITEKSSTYEVLKVTGGSLNSDAYEFVQPIKMEGQHFELAFYLRGWRHYNDQNEKILQTDCLTFQRDTANKHDMYAVQVYKNKEKIIGYVPAFYSQFMSKVLEENGTYKMTDIKFDSKAFSHYKLKISLEGELGQKEWLQNKDDLLVMQV